MYPEEATECSGQHVHETTTKSKSCNPAPDICSCISQAPILATTVIRSRSKANYSRDNCSAARCQECALCRYSELAAAATNRSTGRIVLPHSALTLRCRCRPGVDYGDRPLPDITPPPLQQQPGPVALGCLDFSSNAIPCFAARWVHRTALSAPHLQYRWRPALPDKTPHAMHWPRGLRHRPPSWHSTQ